MSSQLPPGFPGGPAMPPPPEPELRARIREHIGVEPVALPIVAEGFDTSEQPNLQLALDAWLADDGRSGELLGIISDHRRYMGLSMSELLAPGRGPMMGPPPPAPGPVEFVNITLADGRVLQCIQAGLYLLRDGDEPIAATISGPVEQGPRREVRVEVTARTPETAGRFLGQLRELLRRHNVYRGHVLSLTMDMYGGFGLHFHQLPDTGREGIILPEDVLERVERHTIRFAQHRDRLLAAGQHLKRGLLLHGPPGTGKTLTAMYLATQMRDRTILLLTGRSLGLLQRTTAMARILQPSMVILEDVDLIAEERTRSPMGGTPLLFELLNEMDGLASDADVIFLLTTNRPDLLEPALAARPGRIDQAIEIPLPDAGCRTRLFDLYGHAAGLHEGDWEQLVARTDGVSAAFIRELVRKAILFAAEREDQSVTERHLDDALHELVVAGGDLTRSLLGAGARPDA